MSGVLGAVVVAVLALAVRGRRTTHVDSRVLVWLHRDVTGGWVRVTGDASIPAIGLAVLAVVLVAALLTRRYRLAAVAVVGPAVASTLTERVLKPLIDRHYGVSNRPAVLHSQSYPSGHETFVAATAFVALLAACAFAIGWLLRLVCAVVLTAWVLVAGVGLVVNFWHYSSDVLGAIGVAAAVVFGVAMLADRVSSPGDRDRSRTAREV